MKVIEELLNYRDVGKDKILFFTANQVVKQNGALVMGAGNAKALRDTYIGIDRMFGRVLGKSRVVTIEVGTMEFGALVTKQHFKDKSTLAFVTESLRELYAFSKNNPDKELHVPYPAIGFGGLSVKDIQPILEHFPNNVYFYRGK